MDTPRFDLVEIIKVIQRNLKMILGITFAVAALAAIAHFVKDKEYTAEAEVYMLNPLFGDRNHILRRANGDMRFVDYFGTEGDVDKAMTMIESRDVEDSVIAACNLFATYQLDASKAKDRAEMHEHYRASFEAKRTENASLLCSFEDTDPKRAAWVLDMIIKITDARFRNYLALVKNESADRVKEKIGELDVALEIYTDSLIAMRNHYQIYDIINPARPNIMVSSIGAGGKVNAAEGIERIQNVASLKDQIVISRAELAATILELQTNNIDEVEILHYVSTPNEPNKTSGLGLVLTVFAAAFAALFFCVLLFSFTAYIKGLANTER